MRKLSNTEAEMKNSVAYKKKTCKLIRLKQILDKLLRNSDNILRPYLNISS